MWVVLLIYIFRLLRFTVSLVSPWTLEYVPILVFYYFVKSFLKRSKIIFICTLMGFWIVEVRILIWVSFLSSIDVLRDLFETIIIRSLPLLNLRVVILFPITWHHINILFFLVCMIYPLKNFVVQVVFSIYASHVWHTQIDIFRVLVLFDFICHFLQFWHQWRP